MLSARKTHVLKQKLRYANAARNAARMTVQEESNLWQIYKKNYPTGNMIAMAINSAPVPAKPHILVEAYKYANRIKNTNRNKSNYIKASVNKYISVFAKK